jgi:malate dehydrogenase (oxaloacetate-decarboxylating)(NADP+)
VKLLTERGADFEFDGEMAADVALDPALRAALYPFCRLTGPANVLIMPGIHAAHILTRAVPQLTSSTVIGPLLTGLSHSAQIVPMQAGVNQIVDVACLAAHAAVTRG